MKANAGLFCACFLSLLLVTGIAIAKTTKQPHLISNVQVDIDRVGDVDGTNPAPQKALQDTVWIAQWSFDTGAPCDFSGWEKVDNYILNDGTIYWDMDPAFTGTGSILGIAAALGYENDLCCEGANGYDNNWYQAIRIEYAGGGSAELSFDYMLDSEGGYDFLYVEEDSACASFDRVDYSLDPSAPAESYRTVVYEDSGDITAGGSASALALTDFGSGTHCVYIAFTSDVLYSPCDGLQPTSTGKALVVDNIVIVDPTGSRTEDFEDGTLDVGTFVNVTNILPFGPVAAPYNGSWARIYDHITDNDVCTENTSCAVLWTDDVTPSIANDASMSFAPGGYVVKNWLDDYIISPWVDLSTTPTATGTIIQFRRFPGNNFSTSRLVQNWSVRAQVDVDDGLGGTVECISGWGHAGQWQGLSFFGWYTPYGVHPGHGFDMSADFDPTASMIQVRHRTSDWQKINDFPAPPNFVPGPGPYIDRTRIGRQILSGPVIDEGIDAREQAQDAFPTRISTLVSPGTGEHFEPTTNRFGTSAFSGSFDLTYGGTGPNIVTGDSINISVQDVRGAGGIVRIEFYGAIVSGPHAGMAPPPHVIGGNGFFAVAADSVRSADSGNVIQDYWFVDLDDYYFVGGDALQYFWLTEDALGGFTSDPVGLNGVPTSVADAQAATEGMFEVNFLPEIVWDSDYLAAVAVANKVDPLSDESYLDESVQKNCILYVNHINDRRRSGDVNRTSFMYALDRLGYRSFYDVYDHMGMGNTNNQLGSRATEVQAQGYNLIVYDTGNAGPSGWLMPDGVAIGAEKVDQVGWFTTWLSQASTSEAGFATLWVIGSNILQERPTSSLYTGLMGTTLAATDQGLNANPDALGQTSFAFDVGAGTNVVDFTAGAKSEYSLNGGCPVIRNYDGQQSGGSGVNVYLFADPINPLNTGDAAIVMNSNASANYNTILMSHPYRDIREDIGSTPASLTSAEDLVKSVLEGVLPLACIKQEDPTDTGGDADIDATVPSKTVLFQNVPNPFNPTTTLRFDLAHGGHVSLKIYDVAGRLVRTLIDEKMRAGRNIERVWDGLDHAGNRTSSGVYFYRLVAPNFSDVNKMVLMK